MHELKIYNSGARSMGRVLDVLETSLEKIEADPKLVYCEIYIMNIFHDFVEELIPFKNYLQRQVKY